MKKFAICILIIIMSCNAYGWPDALDQSDSWWAVLHKLWSNDVYLISQVGTAVATNVYFQHILGSFIDNPSCSAAVMAIGFDISSRVSVVTFAGGVAGGVTAGVLHVDGSQNQTAAQNAYSAATQAQAMAYGVGNSMSGNYAVVTHTHATNAGAPVALTINNGTATVSRGASSYSRLNATGATCMVAVNIGSWGVDDGGWHRLDVPYTTTVVSWCSSCFYGTGYASRTNVFQRATLGDPDVYMLYKVAGGTSFLWHVTQAVP